MSSRRKNGAKWGRSRKASTKYRKEVWIEALIEVATQVLVALYVKVFTYALIKLLVEVWIEELVEVRNENISRNISTEVLITDTYKSTNLESVRVNGGSRKSQVAVWLYFRWRWKFSRKKRQGVPCSCQCRMGTTTCTAELRGDRQCKYNVTLI